MDCMKYDTSLVSYPTGCLDLAFIAQIDKVNHNYLSSAVVDMLITVVPILVCVLLSIHRKKNPNVRPRPTESWKMKK